MKIEISPSDKSLVVLTTATYEDSQLMQIVQFSGSLNELDDLYPIECIREQDGFYRVSYLGDGSVAVLLFDALGEMACANIYNMQSSNADFDALEEGQSLESVRGIDPNGEYLFLYTGRNDVPRRSLHFTKEGYLITIEYNDSNVITSKKMELI